ncbi:MAG TPA: endonuclease/exonuclease/phosphatase family protein [Blastocatellia bacterium]|nr:endonuclease/exonuclease/phosphatase family protein [Blastocatellia bacterium]
MSSLSRVLFSSALLVMSWLSGFFTVPAVNQNAPDLRVMSFNIRYGTANDGENNWEHRKDFLVETIKSFDPDLLGTQETLGFQRDYLARGLSNYDVLGVGREDGREKGEMAALYYKRSRFEKLDGGHFWLSETPNQPGSKSWDSALPRMVTWVELRDRLQAGSKTLVFLNTHFDHRGVQARIQSAQLLRRRIMELGRNRRVIVTGDFNADEGSEPYQTMFGPSGGALSPLVDTYRVIHPMRAANEGTFTGFKSDATTGPRIDWIAVSRDWEVRDAVIDHSMREGRTPSDHFPVTARLVP